jgi:hypothetical protein
MDRTYLENALQSFFKQYGSIALYLMQSCGIDESTLHNLSKMMIE